MITVQFHLINLIWILPLISYPICIVSCSGSNDRYGLGALLGFGIASFISLIGFVIYTSIRLWVTG